MAEKGLSTEELQRLSKVYRCTSSEIKRLWKRFVKADCTAKGFLSAQEFQGITGFHCNPFASRLAALFSPQGDGKLTFESYLEMHSALHAHTPMDEKITWAFAIWDLDGDGMLDASDMRSGLQLLANGACLEVASAPALRPAGGTPAMFDDQPEVPRAQSRRQSLQGDLLSSYEVNQVLERIAREIEPLGSGISFEEFEEIVSQLPDFLANFRLTP